MESMQLPEIDKRFMTFFQNMVRGVVLGRMIYDKSGKSVDFVFLMVNEACAKLTGIKKEVTGQKISEVLPVLSKEERKIIRLIGSVALTGRRMRFEIYSDRFKNWFDVAVYSPEKNYFYLTFDIITGSKKAYEELKKSEKEIREVNEKLARAQRIAHIGNWERNLLTGQITWSDEMYKIHGMPLHSSITDEVLKKNFPPEEIKKFDVAFINSIENNEPYSHDYRIIRPDGSERYIHTEGSIQRDEKGKAVLMYGTTQDITLGKQAEEKVRMYTEQLRAMANHHEKLREQERLKLSRDIHDVVGVSLSGIKMHLEILRKSLANDGVANPDTFRQIGHLMDITNDIFSFMHNIVKGLRPGILDELGFVETIRWYISELQARTNLSIRFTKTPKQFLVDNEKSIILFRILQELINNIIKHANASQVIITIIKEGRHLLMEVKDNGIGICKDDLEKKNTFGILGIKERMIILKGSVDFSGDPRTGTTVKIMLPLKRNSEKI